MFRDGVRRVLKIGFLHKASITSNGDIFFKPLFKIMNKFTSYMKTAAFWDVIPCCLGEVHWHYSNLIRRQQGPVNVRKLLRTYTA